MKLNINELIRSDWLKEHPISKEPSIYKEKYMTVLSYYVLKYSQKKEIPSLMLENYSKKFGVIIQLEQDITKIKRHTKYLVASKFNIKKFKLFSYRYSLLCDILFLNAFNDEVLASDILNEFKESFNKRYHSKFERLVMLLYKTQGNKNEFQAIEYQINCWMENKFFIEKPKIDIMITATMSAGKSTLINAITGKQLTKTAQEACTSNICRVYNKPFEDDKIHLIDESIKLDAIEQDVISREQSKLSSIASYYNLLIKAEKRFCIIDTPGVNSSLNSNHEKITKKALSEESYDYLVYILNANNLGTDDDLNYLKYISKNVPKEKVIFILNKIDIFKRKEDSIDESIGLITNDLLKLGFENPIVCPISGYFSHLIKLKMNGVELTEDELDLFDYYEKKFSNPEFDLSKYYRKSTKTTNDDRLSTLATKAGIYGLENILFGG